MASQVKQPPMRAESRTRRAGFVDTSAVRPSRARRVPSSSRIEFHTPFPSASTESVAGSSSASLYNRPSASASASVPFLSSLTLHSASDALLHTVSYFTLFAMLHSNPTLPASLLNLPIFVFPTIAFSILALYPFFLRPSFSAIRLHLSRSSSNVATIALVVLMLYSSLTASYAVRHLGPLRALIAFSSYSTISRLFATLIRTANYAVSPASREHYRQSLQLQQQQQTRSMVSSSALSKPKILLVPLFLTTVALVFLVHDASGGRITPERAAHVRERVLRNPTARLMHDHFRNLSTRVSKSIHNKSFPSVHLPLRPTERLRDLRRTLSNIPRKPPPSSKRGSSRRTNRRRSLQPSANSNGLSQNDSDIRPPLPPLQPAPQSVADVHPSASQRQSNIHTINDTLQTNDTVTDANINEGLVGQQMKDSTRSATLNYKAVADETSSKRIEEVIDRDSFPSVPFKRALLAVLLGATSPLARRLGTKIFDRLMFDLGEPTSFLALLFSLASLALLLFSAPFFAKTPVPNTLFDMSDIFTKGSFFGFTFFVIPLISQIRAAGAWRRGLQPRLSKSGLFSLVADVSFLDVATSSPSAPWLYTMAFVTAQTAHAFGWTTVHRAESFSFFSGSAAALFLISAFAEKVLGFKGSRQDSNLWHGRSSSLERLPSYFIFTGRFVLKCRRFVRSLYEGSVAVAAAIADLGAHARTNRASWQVLNFLVLQSGMAVAELIYASATHSSGLFSISADNFFCSVALAVGLFTIRVSTRKSTLRFSYGFFRVESVCGFANGIMLIYVALLIFLEAFERVSIRDEQSAVGRAVSVCLFGIVGNALGLYFFPPETRRENHNVQGIYLHILANTLAFSSVAVSAAASAIVPSQWWVVDICTATIAACVVVASALPLIVRSGRLLLLRVSPEKAGIVQSLQQRLRSIDGVCAMHGLRVWNLTPSCLMASVKLEVEEESDEIHADVLSNARASFAMAGIAASQCTIQIACRKGVMLGESDYPHDGGGSLASESGSASLNRSLYFVDGNSEKAI